VALRAVLDQSAQTTDCAAFGIPRLGERLSGDAAVVERGDRYVFLALVDVLGHGAEASTVAETASSFLSRAWSVDLADTMVRLDHELRGTRGAVAGLCAIDTTSGASRYSGIGDTGVFVLGSDHPGLYSRQGILGSHIPTPRVLRFQLDRRATIVLHSDGVAHAFRGGVNPNNKATAAQLARQIVLTYRRPHDDATCVVAVIGATP
jgi:negative regulator of sigma-B (phosphoserine phosphatase)